MDWDDVRPKPAKAVTLGEDLKALSIAELEARIAALEAEIGRARVEIGAKQAYDKAARDIFKS